MWIEGEGGEGEGSSGGEGGGDSGDTGAADKVETGATGQETGGEGAADTGAEGTGNEGEGDKGADGEGDKAKTGEPEGEKKDDKKAPVWGEKWRDEVLSDLGITDQKAIKAATDRLGKFASPAAVVKALLAGDSKIGELTAAMKGMIKIPGKDAKPEEIAAYHKAIGVPEKPEGYEYTPPEGVEETALDKSLDEFYRAKAHEGKFTAEQYKLGREIMREVQTMAEKARDQYADQFTKETEDALRIAWGADFTANKELMARELPAIFGEEGYDQLRTMRLEDGTMIADHAFFAKAMAQLARERSDGGAFIGGEGQGGVDLDTKIDNIMAKRDTDMEEYKRLQPELDKLIAARIDRDKRAGKRR